MNNAHERNVRRETSGSNVRVETSLVERQGPYVRIETSGINVDSHMLWLKRQGLIVREKTLVVNRQG